MNSKNVAIGIVVAAAAITGAYLVLNSGLPISIFKSDVLKEEGNLKTYASSELKLNFQYPENYILEERTITEGERLHKSIVLIEDTPGNRELLSGEIAGEGPTAITIDVFQNNLDKQSAENFIKNSSNSNYKLGDGELEEGTLAGLSAYRYNWDGLYRGESIVAANDDFVYMFSVTTLTANDEIRKDFYKILDTVTMGEYSRN
jgi:hypothetical protein